MYIEEDSFLSQVFLNTECIRCNLQIDVAINHLSMTPILSILLLYVVCWLMLCCML